MMGGDTRSDALYGDFVESYRAFCRHTGHKLPAAAAASWITWWGPMRLDLRTLFDLLQQHGSLDAQTDLQTWQQVSQSISCSKSCSSAPCNQQQPLPADTVRQLFCTHLTGFRDYQEVQQLGLHRPCTTIDQQWPLRPQQQKVKPLQPQKDKPQMQQMGRAKPQSRPALRQQQPSTHAARAAHCSSRRSMTTGSAAAGRAVGRRSAGSSSSSRAVQKKPGSTAAAAAAADGVRRTGRARVQAVRMGYVASDIIDNDLLAESSSESEDTDADASTDSEAEHVEQQSVQLGPAYQAKLPQLQQRPACPTAAEAKFLTAPIYTPAAEHQQQQEQANHALALPPGQFHAQWVAASSGAARLQLLQQWLQHSDEAMGQGMAERLGLGLLGFKLQAAWSPQEELLFALGMLERYRMFAHMHVRYLPKRSVHELNGYYYSVWKTRAGQVAEEYALLCEQDGDAVKFRQSLCIRLAAMWDVPSMGPIPPSAALPPALAAKLLAKAPAGPKAAAAIAAAAAAANRMTALNRASSKLAGGKAGTAAPPAAGSSSPGDKQHGLRKLPQAAASTGRGAGPGVPSSNTLHTELVLGGQTSSNSSGSLQLVSQQLDASLPHDQGQQGIGQIACKPLNQCAAAVDKNSGSSCCRRKDQQHMEVDQQQQQQQQQLGSPCCSPTAAGQGHSSAGCRSQNSWACSSLLDSDDGGDGTAAAAAAAAGHSRKRARVEDSSADKGRAACASRRQLAAEGGLASDNDCDVIIIDG